MILGTLKRIERMGPCDGSRTKTPCCRANVNASISDPSVPSISDAFTYNDVYPGFAMFLAVADSTAVNLAKVQALRKFRWLDNYTQKVTINVRRVQRSVGAVHIR